MKTLNYETLKEIDKQGIRVGTTKEMPTKVLQFGEGNFLRAFVDYMIDELNSNDLFNGSITVVQPIPQGMVANLKEQDCLYTMLLRGLENGKEVKEKKIVTSIRNAVNPYTDYEEYLSNAYNPDLRFIVSNTTESGIVYNPNDKLEDTPQVSFPGKVTAFLYNRYKHFNGDSTKGLIFLPCELIDNNGTELRRIVLQICKDWNLPSEFITWVEECNYFTNTLVDRIVTGFPRDEFDELTQENGYVDNLINTAEIFHFWVIEGNPELEQEMPFDKIGLDVVWTKDATPYKKRKVRILNGAHTCSVLAAYLAGKDTVKEMVDDELFAEYLNVAIHNEIIPTLDLDYDNLKTFADAVSDRFGNPYIKHYLLSISLNSVSKFKARVMPSITGYYDLKQELPKVLTFSLASLIAFYRGKLVDGKMTGKRGDESYDINDDADVLQFFNDQWATFDGTEQSLYNITKAVCSNEQFFGVNFDKYDNFTNTVASDLNNIIFNGATSAVTELLK